MSADTPECAKLNHLKKISICGNMPPSPLAMYCNTPNSPKNYTSMF